MTPLRIDPGARVVRRRLGPLPWFVLEELLLLSDGTGVAETSVRAIASALSLNKDTVARAVRRLRAEGLVVLQSQAQHPGRFGVTRYEMAPVDGVKVELFDEPVVPRPPLIKRSQSIPSPREAAQLSLIDHAVHPRADHSHRSAPSPPKQDDALAPGVRPAPAGRHRDGGGTSGTAVGPC